MAARLRLFRAFAVCGFLTLTAAPSDGLRAEDAPKNPPAREVADAFRSGDATVRVVRFEPAGGDRRPAVVLLHGCDGWAQMAGYRFAATGLTATGHVAVLVRYYDRTGTRDQIPDADRNEFVGWLRGEAGGVKGGRARRHFDQWAGAVRDAVAYVRKLPNVDPDRVGIVGFSLGGYLALAAAPACDPPVRAAVGMFGGLPAEWRKGLGKLPPTLIVHGEEDDVVPVAEAYEAAGVVVAQKQHVEVEIRPGVGHVLAKPGTDVPDLRELVRARDLMVGFLQKQLAPPVSGTVRR